MATKKNDHIILGLLVGLTIYGLLTRNVFFFFLGLFLLVLDD